MTPMNITTSTTAEAPVMELVTNDTTAASHTGQLLSTGDNMDYGGTNLRTIVRAYET